ncbi:helix-turn-helix transcriptional regulator [Glycocaulis profundi]|nr:helix-turn-helix transcriptional regulator [Glycocaulis profundi]
MTRSTVPGLQPGPEMAEEAAAFLRTLASPARLLLMCRIARGEVSVGELQAELGMRQPGLSQQLAELRAAGLVATRRQSRSILYSLADPRAEPLLETLCAVMSGDVPASRPQARPVRKGDAARFARVSLPVKGDRS